MQLFLTISIVLGVFCIHFAAGLNVRVVPYQNKVAADSRKLEIINGVPAKPGQFPFHVCWLEKQKISSRAKTLHSCFMLVVICQAGLQLPISVPGFNSSCGGSLITNGTVMTAAHCIEIYAEDNPTLINVTLNSLSFFGTTPGAIRVVASGVLMHPGYVGLPNGYENDIALIYLKTPVTTVTPVKLPCPTSNYDGATARIAGYGQTGNETNSPKSLNQLMATNLTVLTNDACNELQSFVLGLMTDLKMCAATVGTDVCFGDSGGALIVNGTAIGISSYLINDGNNYPTYSSVFTRVSSFRSWIDANKRYL